MGTAIGNIFRAIAEFCGLVKQRDAEKNAAPVIQAKTAQDAVNADAVTDEAALQGFLDYLKHDGG